MLAAIQAEQRRSGERYEYYRCGVPFDPSDPDIIARINTRPIPLANTPDAYDVVENARLRAERDAHVESHNLKEQLNVNIARVAAQQNPNDIRQAEADFQALKTAWGNRLTCQSKFQEHINSLFQNLGIKLISTSCENPRYWWYVKIALH